MRSRRRSRRRARRSARRAASGPSAWAPGPAAPRTSPPAAARPAARPRRRDRASSTRAALPQAQDLDVEGAQALDQPGDLRRGAVGAQRRRRRHGAAGPPSRAALRAGGCGWGTRRPRGALRARLAPARRPRSTSEALRVGRRVERGVLGEVLLADARRRTAASAPFSKVMPAAPNAIVGRAVAVAREEEVVGGGGPVGDRRARRRPRRSAGGEHAVDRPQRPARDLVRRPGRRWAGRRSGSPASSCESTNSTGGSRRSSATLPAVSGCVRANQSRLRSKPAALVRVSASRPSGFWMGTTTVTSRVQAPPRLAQSRARGELVEQPHGGVGAAGLVAVHVARDPRERRARSRPSAGRPRRLATPRRSSRIVGGDRVAARERCRAARRSRSGSAGPGPRWPACRSTPARTAASTRGEVAVELGDRRRRGRRASKPLTACQVGTDGSSWAPSGQAAPAGGAGEREHGGEQQSGPSGRVAARRARRPPHERGDRRARRPAARLRAR